MRTYGERVASVSDVRLVNGRVVVARDGQLDGRIVNTLQHLEAVVVGVESIVGVHIGGEPCNKLSALGNWRDHVGGFDEVADGNFINVV